MSLKVTAQIFKWLQSIGLVKQAKRNNDYLQISEDISQKFFDGNHFSLILKNHFSHVLDEDGIKKLQNLRQNSNPAIRLYNWNILLQLLKKGKIIALDSTQKSKIINLESQPVLKILKSLYQIRQKPLKQQKKGLKVQISQISKKSILQTNNSMQFLILLLSKNFKLSPQHTLNLFIDNNKYLSHLLVKGVKNNFHPIYQFLSDIKTNYQYLISHIFCIDEEENVNFFFNALKSCLISKDQNTVLQCLDLWMEMHITYKIKSISTKYLKSWLKSDGINTLFFTITKNSQFFQKIITLCYSYMDVQIFDFFKHTEKSLLWNNDKQKLNFFKKLITLQNNQIVSKFIGSAFIDQWLKYFVKNNKKLKQNDQLNDMNLIFQNLWLLMEQKFEDQALNLINSYLQFLKQLLATQNSINFMSASMSLFNLIKVLGSKKNSYAPFLYRTAVAVFNNISSTDTQKISFYCQNLTISVKDIKNLPGGSLLSSIIKHLAISVNPYLIEMCKVLFQEKRLNEQQSIQILQILTKIIFQDTIYSQMANQIVFEYIPSLNDQLADEYLLNNSKLCLSNFVSQAKNLNKSVKQLKSQFQSQAKHYGEDQNTKVKQKLLDQFKKLLICTNLINFLNKYLDVDDINLKNSLQTVLFHTYIKVKSQLKKKKVADLLMPLMKRYYQTEQELQNQIIEFEKQHYPEQESKQYTSKITLLKSIKLGKSLDLSSLSINDLKTIDPSSLKPSSFALKDLQVLKQKRQHLKTIEVQKEKQTIDSQIKLKQIKNFMNQKRIIEFGSSGRADFQYKGLYDFDSMKEEEVISGVPMIKLINFEKEQQPAYQDDLKSVMKKYRKVWRFLFFKYSTFGAKKQQFKTQEKIHMSQIWKMIRQYQLFTSMKKQQSQTIIKLINDMMKRKNDPQSLTYPGFQEYIEQLCCYGYSKSQYPHLPLGRQVILFIEQLKKSTRQKGGSIDLFQNPEDIYFQQTDVIRQYNKRLRQNPDYILPEGYKKYKQSRLQYEYNIHPMLQKNISSSYVQVYQLLHQILFEKLQLNIIEPLSIKSQITLAKPVLFQNIADKIKEYKKGYLQPKSTIEAKDKDITEMSLKKSIVLKKQFRPHINFSLGIKIGLGSVSVKNKSIAEEVAYWMHDMLNAVQNQSLKIQNSAKKKVQNTVIRRRRVQSFQKFKKQKSEKKQWKKRAQSVKARLQLQKKQKQQQTSKKKQVQIEEKRKKRVRQQQSLRKKLSRFEQMKRVMGEKRQQEKYRKIQEQDKRKQRLQSYRQKVAEYFEKKKQEILQEQQELKKKKQEEQKQKQQKQQKQVKFIKQLYLSNLKKQEQVLEKAEQLKDQYQQLWESQQIQKRLKKHEKQLLYLFNLLLKYQKSKISATSFQEIGLNTLHYFTLKFMLVPFMVEKTQLIKIFNFIIKQKQKKALSQSNEKDTTSPQVPSGKIKSPGLNFKNFQQALFLIAVKSKKLLNKIKQKRQKRIQKLMQFLKQKKGQDGNHFDVQQMSDSSQDQSEQEQQQQKAPGLLQEYLFSVQDVDQDTLQQIFVFLKLPKDKLGVQQRYRQAIETKNLKPKNILKVELKKQMQTVKVQDIPPEQNSDGDE